MSLSPSDAGGVPGRTAGGGGRTARTPPDPSTAYDVAVRLLALRSHSAFELRRKLMRRGFDRETVDSVERRLTEARYLDDGTFAEALVRHRGKSRGAFAIRAELSAKGVDRQLAEEAVAGLDPEEQLESAQRLARTLLARAEPGSLRSLLELAGPRLLRRGYSPRTVREACRRLLAGESAL